MPSTKPVYMGVLLYNGTKYAGLYYKSEKTDGSATAVNQFYWLETNNKGEILDYRTNSINRTDTFGGWYSSQEEAVNNKPSGYTDQIPVIIDTTEFSVGYMPAWLTSSDQGFPYTVEGVLSNDNSYKYTIDAISDMIDAGIDNVILAFQFAHLYYSKAEFDADVNREDVNYIYQAVNKHNIDSLFKRAIELIQSKQTSLKRTITLSIRLESFFCREGWNNMENWNPRLIENADLMVDNSNNISSVIYGRGSYSYASSNAKYVAVNFTKNILNRYVGYANDRNVKIKWISVVTAQTSEAEYPYENEINGSTVARLFDYSDVAVSGFRTWLQSSTGGNYANIGALNTAWGSSFASFNSINKENIAGWNVLDVDAMNKIFATKKGKDFYNYCVYNFYNFYNDIETAISSFNSLGSPIKHMMKSGSNIEQYSANSSAYRRMTFDQSKLKDLYDYNKVWCSFVIGETDNRNQWGAFQCDFARSNFYLYEKSHGTELYAWDFVKQQGLAQDTTVISDAFKKCNTQLVQNNIKEIVYISENRYSAKNYFKYDSAKNGIKDAVEKIKNITTFEEPTKEVTFTIDYLLENGIPAVFNLWKNNGGSTSTRINLHIGDTTSGGGGGSGGGGSGGSVLTALFYTIYQDSSGFYHEFSMNNANFASNIDNIGSNNANKVGNVSLNDGKKYYNFDENGNYTGTDGSLVDTHFQLIMPCHSITNDGTTTSDLVRHKTEIFNGNGTLIWRNEQYKGFRKLSGVDSPLNNSHPSNAVGGAKPQYNQGDSTFFFPLGQNYTIKIYNWAGVFTARIDAVNVNSAIKYYEGKLTTNGTLEFTINPSKITTSYIRGLKVILDRFPDTDSIQTTNIMSQLAP